MGQLADEAAKVDTRRIVDDLLRMRRDTRAFGGKVTNLAAGYLQIREAAADQADLDLLDQRFAESAAAVKYDLDALDANTRQVVDDFFAALGYTPTA